MAYDPYALDEEQKRQQLGRGASVGGAPAAGGSGMAPAAPGAVAQGTGSGFVPLSSYLGLQSNVDASKALGNRMLSPLEQQQASAESALRGASNKIGADSRQTYRGTDGVARDMVPSTNIAPSWAPSFLGQRPATPDRLQAVSGAGQAFVGPTDMSSILGLQGQVQQAQQSANGFKTQADTVGQMQSKGVYGSSPGGQRLDAALFGQVNAGRIAQLQAGASKLGGAYNASMTRGQASIDANKAAHQKAVQSWQDYATQLDKEKVEAERHSQEVLRSSALREEEERKRYGPRGGFALM